MRPFYVKGQPHSLLLLSRDAMAIARVYQICFFEPVSDGNTNKLNDFNNEHIRSWLNKACHLPSSATAFHNM